MALNISQTLNAKGTFLMLGHCPKELRQLRALGWKGICVVPAGTFGEKPMDDDAYYGDVVFVEAHLSHDPHFVRTTQGYWVKPLTVRDVFDQYGSQRFSLIVIDVPMMTRDLWYSEQVQVHMPKYHLVREDGHNEEVMKRATELGYATRTVEGDWLLMGK